ncbi:MAG: POT family MFS transporter [Phycisphaeraceae bacterium]|nr:POT family MFS transporter [Phycisphaeraceae bacterium]MCW5762872.1 POT family MFS transporter [Phycisphaeraceae bacterium]
MTKYRSTPDQNLKGMPSGVPFIIGNELAERFSFYGMKGILVTFMTLHMLNAMGESANMTESEAKAWYHAFTGLAYTFPILGALVADVFWGKYKTILIISLMYCVGHACLAVMDYAPAMGMGMKPWLLAGMLFIAIGAGAIKSCVSAHVGDQFGSGNKRLLAIVFNWFYFSINVGAAVSNLLTPKLLEGIKIGTDTQTGEAIVFGGPWIAFGLPGVLMALATFVFWLGRNKFIHVPPAGWQKFKQETFSPEGIQALKSLAPLFVVFVMMFWAIFDQTGSAWVLQARQMDRNFLGVEWLEAQIQFVNPILILTGIPFFAYVVYPLMGKFFDPTPLRKIGIGFVLAALAFAISAWIESQIQSGKTPNIGWQFVAYLVLTAAEILVSIVCLEFAYTQSPPKMKSFVMGIYFLGVAVGNYFAMGVNWVLESTKNAEGQTLLEGANYYWFFAAMMMITFFAYLVFAKYFYKGRVYIQGEATITARAEAEAPDAR